MIIFNVFSVQKIEEKFCFNGGSVLSMCYFHGARVFSDSVQLSFSLSPHKYMHIFMYNSLTHWSSTTSGEIDALFTHFTSPLTLSSLSMSGSGKSSISIEGTLLFPISA